MWQTLRRLGCASLLCVIASGCGSSGDSGGGQSFSAKYNAALKQTDPSQRARQLMQVAREQHNGKDRKGAELSLKDAAKAAEEVKEPISRSALFTQLASTHALVGNRLEAGRALREAVKSVDGIDAVEARANQLCEIAEVSGVGLEDADRASDILQEAEKMAAGMEDPQGQTYVLVRAARTHHKIKNEADATRLFDQATSQASALEDPVKQSQALIEVAKGLIVIDKKREAFGLLNNAGDAARKVDNEYGQALALANLAEGYSLCSQHSKAHTTLGEADALTGAIKDTVLRQQARDRISQLQRTLPKPAK